MPITTSPALDPQLAMPSPECQLEQEFISKLVGLKYEYRPEVRDRDVLEKNFRTKFEALNRVSLNDAELQRLFDEIITPDVYPASKTLRTINSFLRDDGKPLNCTLVNIKYWCKNTFEAARQFPINTDNCHHCLPVAGEPKPLMMRPNQMSAVKYNVELRLVVAVGNKARRFYARLGTPIMQLRHRTRADAGRLIRSGA